MTNKHILRWYSWIWNYFCICKAFNEYQLRSERGPSQTGLTTVTVTPPSAHTDAARPSARVHSRVQVGLYTSERRQLLRQVGAAPHAPWRRLDQLGREDEVRNRLGGHGSHQHRFVGRLGRAARQRLLCDVRTRVSATGGQLAALDKPVDCLVLVSSGARAALAAFNQSRLIISPVTRCAVTWLWSWN